MYLREQDAIKQQLCLRLVLGDVGVGIHAEDFRRGIEGQRLGVLNVTVVLQTKKTKEKNRQRLSVRQQVGWLTFVVMTMLM